jgi:hypothetical protein
MTATTLEMAQTGATTTKPAARPSVVGLWLSGVLVHLFPPASRMWLPASLWQASVVAAVNTLLAIGWAFASVVCANLWVRSSVSFVMNVAGKPRALAIPEHWAGFFETAGALANEAADEWHRAATADVTVLVCGVIGMTIASYLVPFFVLLPFATRPGRNKACVRHVARTVLLGSGLVHWWGVAFCVALALLSPRLKTDYAEAVSPLLLVFSGLMIWNLIVLVLAARRDYRGPEDQPQPHDPLCDECGYNLVAADYAGRCPECGRLVADSLGGHTRPPTPWEARPSFLNIRVISNQAGSLVRHPRRLFGSMPTLTGQRAAQRWLIGSMIVISLMAAMMVPALFIALDSGWSSVAFSGALAMGIFWAIFGMMMVGIETTGIATFSRMRGHKIYLSAASKVTSYSAILMVPWVVLGGIQLVTFIYFAQPEHNLHRLFGLSVRGEQVVLTVSLALAHIGGLLWYELTVYRGVRAIQFANK